MRDWAAEFNALPREVRRIGQAMELRTRIQHLRFERERLKKRYDASIREIDEYICRCTESLKALDAPTSPAEALSGGDGRQNRKAAT
jgi:hypothetical protein